MVREFFLRPEGKAKLEKVRLDAKGEDTRYTLMLCSLLGEEVYPEVLRSLGLPDVQSPLHFVIDAMGHVGADLELTRLWLQSELVMKNPQKIMEAYSSLEHLHKSQGLPPPDLSAFGVTFEGGVIRPI